MNSQIVSVSSRCGTTDKLCKNYKKKKSMSMFALVKDRENDGFKHIEMLRIVNKKDGEFYVLPAPGSGYDLHLSYHRSGQFHMAFNREHRFFINSDQDFCGAFHDYLWMQFASGWIQGFCFSVHKNVSKTSLERMLHIITDYCFVDLTSSLALNDLFLKKQASQFPQKPYPRVVLDRPVSSGFMVVVLKSQPNFLHTVNCTIVSAGDTQSLSIYRINKNERRIISPGGDNEVVEVSSDEIQSTIFVQF